MNNINLLIKPSSSNCNMNCNYCFYKDESSKRNNYSYGFMSNETIEIIVKKALCECIQSVSFMFQGGEPTLIGLSFYKNLVDLQKKHNINNITIHNSIQTNGYVINEEWASFFAENNFLVGLSLDGFEELHNKQRKDNNEKGTFDKIYKCTKLFERYDVQYNILSVVTKDTVKYAQENYEFFRDNGYDYIQYIPCLDELEESRGENSFSLTPKLYSKFLKETFDCWYNDCKKNNGISIRNFDNYLMILLGHHPENCGMNGKCSLNAVIEANGNVYPCDFYAIDKYFLGNICDNSFNELLSSSNAKKFLHEQTIDNRCLRCKYGYLCRGGCRRDKIQDERGTINYFCSSYKNFFDYTLNRFIEISKMKKHPYRFMNK